MWARGDHGEGIKWVRKAAEAASEAEVDAPGARAREDRGGGTWRCARRSEIARVDGLEVGKAGELSDAKYPSLARRPAGGSRATRRGPLTIGGGRAPRRAGDAGGPRPPRQQIHSRPRRVSAVCACFSAGSRARARGRPRCRDDGACPPPALRRSRPAPPPVAARPAAGAMSVGPAHPAARRARTRRPP